MNLINQLVEYGLNENESRVYTVLLEEIEATAFVIAAKASIPRTTTYATLELLKKKGLISSSKKNGVLYFTPENVGRLNSILEEKKEILNSILPQLEALTGTGRFQPNVKMFVGKKAVKAMLDDVLEVLKKDKIRTLYAVSHPVILEFLPKYFKRWLEKRESLGVNTQLLMQKSSEGQSALLDKNSLRQVRYMPSQFIFDATVNIYGKKVSFLALREGEIYGVLIESETIVNIIRNLFLFAWDNAKEG
jgi:sugar-specific transcriptional regulator TrmB